MKIISSQLHKLSDTLRNLCSYYVSCDHQQVTDCWLLLCQHQLKGDSLATKQDRTYFYKEMVREREIRGKAASLSFISAVSPSPASKYLFWPFIRQIVGGAGENYIYSTLINDASTFNIQALWIIVISVLCAGIYSCSVSGFGLSTHIAMAGRLSTYHILSFSVQWSIVLHIKIMS